MKLVENTIANVLQKDSEGNQNIILSFKLLESTDKQNVYLCGPISIVPVKISSLKRALF